MSPVPARATLVELPSRANSTVRRPSVPIPSPRQLAVSAQPPVIEVQASPKAIKKEKTRSRVWGLLGIRSKKSKDVLTKVAPPVGYIAPARAVVQQDQHTLTPSRGKSLCSQPCVETHYSAKTGLFHSCPQGSRYLQVLFTRSYALASFTACHSAFCRCSSWTNHLIDHEARRRFQSR